MQHFSVFGNEGAQGDKSFEGELSLHTLDQMGDWGSYLWDVGGAAGADTAGQGEAGQRALHGGRGSIAGVDGVAGNLTASLGG
jgi:hypothetical protein